MAKFRITAPRYLRQRGQSEPEYVYAAPEHPVVVDLPDENDDGTPLVVKKNNTIQPVEETFTKPRPAFVDRKAVTVPKAAEVAKTTKPGTRAADT